MSKPTRYEIMRCNRPKLRKARETLRERIDRIEQEVTAQWEPRAAEDLRRVAERMARERERALPLPSGRWVSAEHEITRPHTYAATRNYNSRWQKVRDFGWLSLGAVVTVVALIVDYPLTHWARKRNKSHG